MYSSRQEVVGGHTVGGHIVSSKVLNLIHYYWALIRKLLERNVATLKISKYNLTPFNKDLHYDDRTTIRSKNKSTTFPFFSLVIPVVVVVVDVDG